jgi:hypothetical protein
VGAELRVRKRQRVTVHSSRISTMIVLSSFVAAALASLVPGPSARAPQAGAGRLVLSADIRFDERLWSFGSLPTLTFTVSSGRGFFGKMQLFLYASAEPGAVATSPYPPQFVGEVIGSGAVNVVVDRTPERGPVNPFSHEMFYQGALVDPLTGTLLGVTNEDYLDIAYESMPESLQLDFETDDDFATPFVNGQDLSTPPEFGRLVSIDSRQPFAGQMHYGPAIFDSSPTGPNMNAEDTDLLVDTGNVVILQESMGQITPGIFTHPDDSAGGGTIVFDFTGFAFTQQVEPVSIRLIDIDVGAPRASRVILTDVLGRTRTYIVPAGWTGDLVQDGPPGYAVLDLTTLLPQPGLHSSATASQDLDYIPGEVVRMEIELGGSGAIDDLIFRREADPGTSRNRAKRR